MRLIFNWLISAIAIVIAAYLLPNVEVNSFGTALVVAVVLGLVNAFIKPFLIILTLPVNILTLGLFTLVINAFLVWLAQLIVPGFDIANFGWAFLFAVLLSLVSMIFRSLDRNGRTKGAFRGQNY